MYTYQVNIRYKIPEQGSRDSKSPDSITHSFKNGKIENLFCRRKMSFVFFFTSFGIKNERLICKTSQEQNKYKNTEDPESVVQAD